MKLGTLRIEGFKCFPYGVTFDFNRGPGLYFLTGRNEKYPELGANAVGKSSLLDALSWIFYGKTVRKLKAKDVVPWGSTGYTGVILEIDGQYLHRRRNPNYLCWVDSDGLELQPIQQKEMEEIIGLSFDAFTNSILFGQFTRPFLDLTPSEKEKLFSDTLALDKWFEYSDNATKRVHDIESCISTLEKEQARVEGELSRVEEADYKAQAEKWYKENNVQMEYAIEDLANVDKKLRAVRNQIRDGKVKREKALDCIADIALDLLDASNESQQLVEVERSRSAKLVEVTTRLDLARDSLDKLGDDGQCSLCGQDVSDSIYDEFAATVRELECKAAIVDSAVIDASIEKKDSVRRLSALQKERTEYKDSSTSLGAQIDSDCVYLARLKTDENTLSIKVSALKKESNPFTKLERDRVESAILLRKELEKHTVRINYHKDRLESYRYWVKGFKGVRLFLMDDRLQELEYEINNALGDLGLKEWRIALTTEREVGRGSKRAYRPGFCVRIDCGNGESIPWEAWSGGESQRLRLAGSMGYANMILNNAGIQSDIEFWDEPSTWLSEEGIDDLLETLYYRAQNLKKQIWVVDHRALQYGGFASTVIVVKDEKGSYFEEVA